MHECTISAGGPGAIPGNKRRLEVSKGYGAPRIRLAIRPYDRVQFARRAHGCGGRPELVSQHATPAFPRPSLGPAAIGAAFGAGQCVGWAAV